MHVSSQFIPKRIFQFRVVFNRSGTLENIFFLTSFKYIPCLVINFASSPWDIILYNFQFGLAPSDTYALT